MKKIIFLSIFSFFATFILRGQQFNSLKNFYIESSLKNNLLKYEDYINSIALNKKFPHFLKVTIHLNKSDATIIIGCGYYIDDLKQQSPDRYTFLNDTTLIVFNSGINNFIESDTSIIKFCETYFVKQINKLNTNSRVLPNSSIEVLENKPIFNKNHNDFFIKAPKINSVEIPIIPEKWLLNYSYNNESGKLKLIRNSVYTPAYRQQ